MYPAKCNFLRDSKIILVIFAPAYYQVNVTNTLLKESGQKIMFSIKNSDNTRVRVFSEILQLGAKFSIFFFEKSNCIVKYDPTELQNSRFVHQFQIYERLIKNFLRWSMTFEQLFLFFKTFRRFNGKGVPFFKKSCRTQFKVGPQTNQTLHSAQQSDEYFPNYSVPSLPITCWSMTYAHECILDIMGDSRIYNV